MKAVTCDRYGRPEVLRLAEMARPEPGPGEVLVRVETSTVNRTDTATLRAHPFFARPMTGWLRPRHRITGMDFAGTVEAVGPGVSEFAESERVFGMSPETFGAHAEYLVVPEAGPLVRIPESVATEDAVICEGAWYAQSTVRRLGPGQSILVYGATGAIGTAAVQLAVARGAKVTAVAGTRHLNMVRGLGPERVIDYEAEDFTRIGEKFDIVFDAVGHTSYFACRGLLGPGGQYCATDLGPWWSNIWLGLFGRSVGVPFPGDAAGFVRELAGLMAEGKVRGVFDRRFGFEDVVAAYRYVEGGHKTGIVRLDIAG